MHKWVGETRKTLVSGEEFSTSNLAGNLLNLLGGEKVVGKRTQD